MCLSALSCGGSTDFSRSGGRVEYILAALYEHPHRAHDGHVARADETGRNLMAVNWCWCLLDHRLRQLSG